MAIVRQPLLPIHYLNEGKSHGNSHHLPSLKLTIPKGNLSPNPFPGASCQFQGGYTLPTKIHPAPLPSAPFAPRGSVACERPVCLGNVDFVRILFRESFKTHIFCRKNLGKDFSYNSKKPAWFGHFGWGRIPWSETIIWGIPLAEPNLRFQPYH